MRINSKPFGIIDVDERQKLKFPHGLLGFEDLTEYVLLDASQPPFYWLQSLEDQEIAFVLIDPKMFKPDYTPELSEQDLEEIGISDPEDQLVFAIVTIPEKQELMTANLQGPIVVNKTLKTARQSISVNPRWMVKHFIIEELEAVRDTAC
jgi:flagellar assembly factor FliW